MKNNWKNLWPHVRMWNNGQADKWVNKQKNLQVMGLWVRAVSACLQVAGSKLPVFINHLMVTFLTCSISHFPANIFSMPSCFRVVIPSLMACALISSILALF